MNEPTTGVDSRSGSWVLGFLLGVGCAVQPVSFFLNTQPMDLLITVMLLSAVVGFGRGAVRAWTVFSRCLPWLWLIAVADVVALTTAGGPDYGALQTLRDLFAFAIFFVLLVALENRERTQRGLFFGLVVGAVICAVLVVVSGDDRPVGTFQNPNYAAHFLAAMLVLVASRRRQTVLKFALLGLIAVGMISTFSFGALSFVGAAGAYWLWRDAGGSQKILFRVVAVVTVSLVLLSGVVLTATQSSTIQDSELGGARYDRSSSAREDGWRAALALVPTNPQGVGPGEAANAQLVLNRNLELHSDPIAYLVERGFLGLIGLIGLFVALWRVSPPSGRARVLLVGFAVGSLTRETLNYRHLWVILALALIWDFQERRAAATSVSTGDVESPRLPRVARAGAGS